MLAVAIKGMLRMFDKSELIFTRVMNILFSVMRIASVRAVVLDGYKSLANQYD